MAQPEETDSPRASYVADSPATRPLHVVGIGASAGGLDALERFFDHLTAPEGMAFVIVQRLSPDFKSLTDELLARHTKLPSTSSRTGCRWKRGTST